MNREPKPEIEWDELIASTSTPQRVNRLIHRVLVSAIENKLRVTLTLTSGVHISAEPHVYGVRDGQPSLLIYVAKARPVWQLVDATQVDDVETSDEHFEKRKLPPEFDPDRATH